MSQTIRIEDTTVKALTDRIAELDERNLGLQDTILRLSTEITERGHTIAELERIGETRQDILEILESRIHEACEVYAGMEGFIPETAPEAYCLRIIGQMNKTLLGGGDE